MTKPPAADSRLARTVEGSRAWRRARTLAADYIRTPEKLKSLIDRAARKSSGARPHWAKELAAALMSMIRLLRAYWAGEYRQISKGSLAIIVASVAYFVMPFDVIPDWILGLGFLDDAYVIGIALRTVSGELERFVSWERDRTGSRTSGPTTVSG
jgi:uncharacterized membrane protein YkvA (DUF1232 family)